MSPQTTKLQITATQPPTQNQQTTTSLPKLEKKDFSGPGLKLPSLNDIKNPPIATSEEAKTISQTGGRLNKPFTLEELKIIWSEYAEKFKAEGKASEYIILANRSLELQEDYSIKLQLDNLVQVDQLNSFKPDLLEFLRKKLGNSLLMIETSVLDKPTERKPYSQSEKLQHLIENYPIVADLKKRLGLDMDY